MRALTPRTGYRLWAPHYETETAVSYLEDRTVAELSVPTAGCRLLDVGCGTGRRLHAAGAAFAVGIDLTAEMLRRARDTDLVAAADARALPFASESFDVVWCRLVIGHVSDIDAAYAELARVCRPDGAVVVSDFSPDAIAVGHRRTFRDRAGVVREVQHFVHSRDTQVSVANRVGLELEMRRAGVVGPGIKRFYDEAGRLPAYEAQVGLPIVVAQSWRKRRT
ncbi:MAG: methyltransferase domain-containing protein [bacterium]